MKSGIITATAIIVVLGTTIVSCKKEQIAKCRKAQLTAVEAKNGGDDDEDPVIRGKVQKKNTFVVISNAYVETMAYGTNIRAGSVYTDSLGNFKQKVPAGAYYFKVTIAGSSTPSVTDTIHVNKDIDVTISLD